MRPHLRYLSYVLRHKWFVLVAGLRVGGIPLWRLLVHDWSKFTPAEWGPYAEWFYGYHGQTWEGVEESHEVYTRRIAYDRAWLHHQHANPHHWQHWLLRLDDGPTLFLEMPEHFAREMVADWLGAGRAITGRWDVREWYGRNAERILLHRNTRQLVERLIWEVRL